MVPTELVAALTIARRCLTQAAWQHVAGHLATVDSHPSSDSIQAVTAGLVNRDAAWMLTQAFQGAKQVAWPEIAAAMVAVDYACGDGQSITEVLWTGPADGRVPLRRIDQKLYDLISAATRRIVLVTFAAYRVPHLCEHLTRAAERGVGLTLIVESAAESDGQLSMDAVDAFRGVPGVMDSLYYWPLARRERNQAGRPGKLHAKCAIVDEMALISSANFTDDAFNRNMELGVLVKDHAAVSTIVEHFQELIRVGVLVRAGTPTHE